MIEQAKQELLDVRSEISELEVQNQAQEVIL